MASFLHRSNIFSFIEQFSFLFNTKFNCLHDYQQRPSSSSSLAVTTASAYFRPIILANHMKKRQKMSLALQPMMINDDQKYPIELMQQQQSSSSSSVNHSQSSRLTIYDNNHPPSHLTERKTISSSSSSSSSIQIRLGLRCSCPVDEKHEQLFDQIFSNNEQSMKWIFNEYISLLTNKTFILLSGQYQQISELQNTLITLTLTRLYDLINDNNNHDLILRITIEQFFPISKSIFLPSANLDQTSKYLQRICSHHQTSPCLLTFDLIYRSTNCSSIAFHLLATNDHSQTRTSEETFANLLLSLIFPSIRQKQSAHLSTHEQSSISSSLSAILHQDDEHRFYILAIVNHEKQLKYWTTIQRLLNSKTNRSSVISMSTVEKQEEIWVDGPFSQNEIWIDGPRSTKIRLLKSTPKHRSKAMYTKSKLPLRSSPSNFDESTFDTESIVSSHCHLPILPVFKDHSLLPFRANQQTLPRPKPPLIESTKINLKLSTNQLNDDLEMLEKTLETLLVPSPIVPTNLEMTKSLNRMEQISSLMTNDEKNKRLSRIVSPTRFEKILNTQENCPPSVPSSPFLLPKNRHSRTSNRSGQSTKKPKIPLRTTSLAETTSRPSIFQRLFGLRSSIHSPPLSPLTVTLDSHDDLMPLTTSSTASSGRASSSGYESMSNTVLEEMIASNRVRNRTSRKEDRRMNSPIMQYQQRLTQLKHRQNELKLELAMTRTFLLIDKNKIFDHRDSMNSSIPNNPLHTMRSNIDQDEEDELEKDIAHLEKRLALAKSQLLSSTHQKNKPFKS